MWNKCVSKATTNARVQLKLGLCATFPSLCLYLLHSRDREWCLHQASKHNFNLLWPWYLTSWPMHEVDHSCPCSLPLFFQNVLRWSVAVSTVCHHSSRVVAFLQAVARPKFRGPKSASIARSQVWLRLPAGRFQSGGTCRIHAARAQWWSSRGELRAIWPKSRRRLLVTRWERG